MSILFQQIVRQKQLRFPDQWQLKISQRPGLGANVDRPLPVWSDLKQFHSPTFCSAHCRASTWPESRMFSSYCLNPITRVCHEHLIHSFKYVWSSERNFYYCLVSNLHITQSCTNFSYYIGVLISLYPDQEGNNLGSMSGTRPVSTTFRRELLSSYFFLQGKAPKEIHAILTETLACSLPVRAKDLLAPLYTHLINVNFFFILYCEFHAIIVINSDFFPIQN